jgi:hypothetical protein
VGKHWLHSSWPGNHLSYIGVGDNAAALQFSLEHCIALQYSLDHKEVAICMPCMQAAAISAQQADATALLSSGHLLVVRSLLRVLPHARFAKATVDAVIDACAAMQNLRSVIVRYRANMLNEAREDKRARILAVVTVCTSRPTYPPRCVCVCVFLFWLRLSRCLQQMTMGLSTCDRLVPCHSRSHHAIPGMTCNDME